jgi:hypothetical protein
MRKKILGAVAVGLAAIVAVVVVPGVANASLGDGSRILFQNRGDNNNCMGVAGGDAKVQDGAAIVTWPCDGSKNQTWVLSLVNANSPAGPYFIKNSAATSECLSIAGKSKAEGARVVLWHCKDAPDNEDQQWNLTGDRQAPYTYLDNSYSLLRATAFVTIFGARWMAQEPPSSTWFPQNSWTTVPT